MVEIFTYTSTAERLSKVAAAQAMGMVMRHDEIRDGAPTLIFEVPAPNQPSPAFVAHKQRRTRIAEINTIPRSNWTTAQLRELIDLLAQELIQ